MDVELQSLINQADALLKNITSSKDFEAPANKESIMKDYEAKIVSAGGEWKPTALEKQTKWKVAGKSYRDAS